MKYTVDWSIESKKDWAVCFEITKSLCNLVSDISCVDVREDKCICMTRNLRLWALCAGYTWCNCCVKLDFSLDWKIWIFLSCLVSCVSHLVNILALS